MQRTTVLILAIFLVLASCSEDSNPIAPPSGGKIDVGSFTDGGTTTISTAGGQLNISSGQLAGFAIKVPSGAFRSPRSVSVQFADIKSHTFGSVFNPISPLIRIEAGTEYAEEPLTIVVPITLPAGHFAMGFFYDESTGELEGIPVLTISDKSIELSTAHLSGKFLSFGAKGGIMGSKPYVDVIISSIAEGELNAESASTFVPGVDDWEFENWGSYIASGGHCAGQSISAMWYYHVKKLQDGAPPLYGRFEMGHKQLSIDNPYGYRFASVVHEMIDWTKRGAWLTQFEIAATPKLSHDSLHYYSFCYSIKVTKRPQYVSIRDAADNGHAIIAYKAGNGKIWVADPNHPGKANRFIEFQANGTFAPYMAGSTALDPGTPFPHINYVSKSSHVDHSGIPARYDQLVTHTIGTVPPHTFPTVRVEWLDGANWRDVPDTITTSNDTIQIRSVCVGCGVVYPGNLTGMRRYNENTKFINGHGSDGILRAHVGAGTNDLHLMVMGWPAAGSSGYIDYKHVVVKKEQQGMATYWLKGVLNQKDTIHFGILDAPFTLPGTWVNNTTFKIDVKTTMTDPKTGQQLPVTAKMTFVFTADLATVSTAEVYFQTVYQGNDIVLADFTAKNIPRVQNTQTQAIYEVTGQQTCSHITNIDFTGALVKPTWWGCDEECFVKILLVK